MRPLVLTALLPMLMACTSTTPQKSEAAGLRETKIYERRWECVDCTPEEKKVVAYLQDVKINDKNAIATILGNIRQESNFIANICELCLIHI